MSIQSRNRELAAFASKLFLNTTNASYSNRPTGGHNNLECGGDGPGWLGEKGHSIPVLEVPRSLNSPFG